MYECQICEDFWDRAIDDKLMYVPNDEKKSPLDQKFGHLSKFDKSPQSLKANELEKVFQCLGTRITNESNVTYLPANM